MASAKRLMPGRLRDDSILVSKQLLEHNLLQSAVTDATLRCIAAALAVATGNQTQVWAAHEFGLHQPQVSRMKKLLSDLRAMGYALPTVDVNTDARAAAPAAADDAPSTAVVVARAAGATKPRRTRGPNQVVASTAAAAKPERVRRDRSESTSAALGERLSASARACVLALYQRLVAARLLFWAPTEMALRSLAAAYVVLVDGCSQELAASRFGQSQPVVSRYKRKLDELLETGYALPAIADLGGGGGGGRRPQPPPRAWGAADGASGVSAVAVAAGAVGGGAPPVVFARPVGGGAAALGGGGAVAVAVGTPVVGARASAQPAPQPTRPAAAETLADTPVAEPARGPALVGARAALARLVSTQMLACGLITNTPRDATLRCIAAAYAVLLSEMTGEAAAARFELHPPQVSRFKRKLEQLVAAGYALPRAAEASGAANLAPGGGAEGGGGGGELPQLVEATPVDAADAKRIRAAASAAGGGGAQPGCALALPLPRAVARTVEVFAVECHVVADAALVIEDLDD